MFLVFKAAIDLNMVRSN